MFYVGDQCTIVACNHGHQFNLGEAVEVMEASYDRTGTSGSYRIRSLEDPSQHQWSVTDEEIELVEPDAREVQAAINSIKSVQQ